MWKFSINSWYESLLDSIKGYFPSPDISKAKVAIDSNNKEILVKLNKDMPFSAFVFKTIADPFVGKLSIFKVQTGELTTDKIIINSKNNKIEKVSSLCFLRGKSQIQTNKIGAGDIELLQNFNILQLVILFVKVTLRLLMKDLSSQRQL